jgi:hypothetical protein
MSLAPTSSTQAGIDGQVLYADAQAVTVVQSRVEEVEPFLGCGRSGNGWDI